MSESRDPIPKMSAHPDSRSRVAPTSVAGCHIQRELGRGGWGVVYLAEQTEPVRRKVAVKVIKLGQDTEEVLSRFEQERQALAMMNHRGIAAVHDAGVTEHGAPFFMMEFIPGVPITTCCDTHELTLAERLGLFGEVCHAVQHAHQKGVVHRDLKPANILVARDGDDFQPKIIDFGVAKALDQRLSADTLHTQFPLGTWEYMSPEQAETSPLGVDTRSDVYSLGVVLYELLAGALPHESSEIRNRADADRKRFIQDVDPPRLSARYSSMEAASRGEIAARRRLTPASLTGRLRGELEWIVQKAMDKDPRRRYASASELAADLQRYLNNEPVLASPPSTIYRVRKFSRRNRVALAMVGLAFGAVVAIAVVTTSLLNVTASLLEEKTREQEEKAAIAQELQRQLLRQDKTSGHVSAAVEVAKMLAQTGQEPTVRELLAAMERQSAEIEDAALEATLRTWLGDYLMSFEDYESAIKHYSEAEQLLQRAHAGEDQIHPAVLSFRRFKLFNLHTQRALSLIGLGDYPKAEALAMEAARRIDELEVGDDLSFEGWLRARRAVAMAQVYQYKHESIASLLALERDLRESQIRRPQLLGLVLNMAAQAEHLLTGDNVRAEACSREAHSLFRESLGDHHPDTLAEASTLAVYLNAQEKYEEAVNVLAELIPLRERVVGPDAQGLAYSRYAMGWALVHLGRLEEAMPYAERAAAAAFRNAKADDTLVLNTAHLVRLAADWEPQRSAEIMVEATAAMREAGRIHERGGRKLLHSTARSLRHAERYSEAAEAFREVADLYARAEGPGQAQAIEAVWEAAFAYDAANNPREAEFAYKVALERLERHAPDRADKRAHVMASLARYCAERNESDSATALLLKAFDLIQGYDGVSEHTSASAIAEQLSALYQRAGDDIAAVRWMEMAEQERVPTPSNP